MRLRQRFRTMRHAWLAAFLLMSAPVSAEETQGRIANDGAEIFYRTFGAGPPLLLLHGFFGTGESWALDTDPSFAPGNPELVFEGNYFAPAAGSWPSRTYDVSRDGQSFLMIKEAQVDESSMTELNVVLNWTEELKRLVPTQ